MGELSNLIMDFMKFLNDKIIWLNQSEKQNESEEKSQNFMIALAFILVLTFSTGEQTWTADLRVMNPML